jgi:hypothetical protein
MKPEEGANTEKYGKLQITDSWGQPKSLSLEMNGLRP